MSIKARFLTASVIACAALGASAQTIERMKLTDNDLSCAQIYAEAQQMDAAIQLAGPGAPMTVAAPASGQPAVVPAGSACPTVPGVPGCVSAAGAAAANQSAAVLNQGRAQQFAMMGGASGCVQVPGIPGCADPASAAAYADVQARQRGARAALGGLPTQAGLQGQVIADPNVQASIARARASGMSEAQINATVGLGMQRGGLGALAAPVAAPQAAGLGGMLGALAGLGGQKTAPPAAAPSVAQAAPSGAGSLGAQARARKDYLTGLFLSRGCRMSDVQK